MPYETEYLDEEGAVITTYWGTITDEDIVESGKQKCLYLDKLKSYRYSLTDLSRIENFRLSTAGIRGNADVSSRILNANKNLIVLFVLPTDAEFGMGRMWESYAEKYNVESHIFRSRAEADAWIENNMK